MAAKLVNRKVTDQEIECIKSALLLFIKKYHDMPEMNGMDLIQSMIDDNDKIIIADERKFGVLGKPDDPDKSIIAEIFRAHIDMLFARWQKRYTGISDKSYTFLPEAIDHAKMLQDTLGFVARWNHQIDLSRDHSNFEQFMNDYSALISKWSRFQCSKCYDEKSVIVMILEPWAEILLQNADFEDEEKNVA